MTTINASNVSGVIITSDTSGNLILQSNGNTVATLTSTSANAGIQMATWVAPAFSAYQSVAQTLTGSFGKVSFQTEEFDTANCFDSVTNYRFTPNVAGYYQFNGQLTSTATGYTLGAFYKNGVFSKSWNNSNAGGPTASVCGSALIFMNGTTDYAEVYAATTAAGIQSVGSANNFFQAFLARSA